MKTIVFEIIGLWAVLSVLAIGTYPILGLISFALSLLVGAILVKKGKMLQPEELNDRFEPTKENLDYSKIRSVIAPNGCRSYFTPGKEYILIGSCHLDGSFSIISDTNILDYCLFWGDAHLNGDNWIIGRVEK
jgi:hypothetical protein